ncbi:hypothetical protein N9Z45_02950, partial [Akkermansiaceae bacterium]|nr:hypothetical protein [Akkermansiaceae bacterium]
SENNFHLESWYPVTNLTCSTPNLYEYNRYAHTIKKIGRAADWLEFAPASSTDHMATASEYVLRRRK